MISQGLPFYLAAQPGGSKSDAECLHLQEHRVVECRTVSGWVICIQIDDAAIWLRGADLRLGILAVRHLCIAPGGVSVPPCGRFALCSKPGQGLAMDRHYNLTSLKNIWERQELPFPLVGCAG